jgi:uncharacterized MAPEG superfamily protein
MKPAAALPFVILLLGMTTKFVALTLIQALRRTKTRTFRWPEDAAHWRGVVVSSDEDPQCLRAQAALRNDGESQPYFLLAAAAWIWLGADETVALILCSTYVALRALHSAFLLWPRQPLRNRIFGLSVVCLFVVLGDCVRLLLLGRA